MKRQPGVKAMASSLAPAGSSADSQPVTTINRGDLLAAVQSVIANMSDNTEQTKQDYLYRVQYFLDYVRRHGFARDTLRAYRRYLSEIPDIAASTKNGRFFAAKMLLQELAHRNYIPDITQNVKGFSRGRKHKKEGLNPAEVMRIANTLRSMPDTPATHRLRAIITLLALQGLRQVEVVRLNRDDVDLVNKTLLVLGKGTDDRELVNLHPVTVSALKAHIEASKVADGPLFTSRATNYRYRRLTTRSVRKMVKELFNDLGIDRTTHGFRHYFVTAMLQALDGNIRETAKYTRHRALDMLMVYDDNISHKKTLPRYYRMFDGFDF